MEQLRRRNVESSVTTKNSSKQADLPSIPPENDSNNLHHEYSNFRKPSKPIRTSPNAMPIFTPFQMLTMLLAMCILAGILLYYSEEPVHKPWVEMTEEERKNAGIARVLWEIRHAKEGTVATNDVQRDAHAVETNPVKGGLDMVGFCDKIWSTVSPGCKVEDGMVLDKHIDTTDIPDISVFHNHPGTVVDTSSNGIIAQIAAKHGKSAVSLHPRLSNCLKGSICKFNYNITLYSNGISDKTSCNLFQLKHGYWSDCDGQTRGEYLSEYSNVPGTSLRQVSLLHLNLPGSEMSTLQSFSNLPSSITLQLSSHVPDKTLLQFFGSLWSKGYQVFSNPNASPLTSLEKIKSSGPRLYILK